MSRVTSYDKGIKRRGPGRRNLPSFMKLHKPTTPIVDAAKEATEQIAVNAQKVLETFNKLADVEAENQKLKEELLHLESDWCSENCTLKTKLDKAKATIARLEAENAAARKLEERIKVIAAGTVATITEAANMVSETIGELGHSQDCDGASPGAVTGGLNTGQPAK